MDEVVIIRDWKKSYFFGLITTGDTGYENTLS